MNSEEFHREYEASADREEQAMMKLSADELLDRVRRRTFGEHYTLWRVIAKKATLQQAAWPIVEMLESDAPFHVRYHAAAALIHLAGPRGTEWTVISLSSGPAFKENVKKLAAELAAIVGPR